MANPPSLMHFRQELAITSPLAGTTTDPIWKAIEVPGIGPLVLGDTRRARRHNATRTTENDENALLIPEADMIIYLAKDEESYPYVAEEKISNKLLIIGCQSRPPLAISHNKH